MQNYETKVSKKTPVWWDGIPEHAVAGRTRKDALDGDIEDLDSWSKCEDLPNSCRVCVNAGSGKPQPKNMFCSSIAKLADNLGFLEFQISAYKYTVNIVYLDKVKVIYEETAKENE